MRRSFTPDGFFLNGKHLKLRGLNRHQTYPFVGQAMPARVQRRDAWILRKDFKCNIVRTSHYPQSPHFLDACDELWPAGFGRDSRLAAHRRCSSGRICRSNHVETMIRRDWNHPSIIMWGVRVNESRDDHDFYTRTNQVAHSLDDSRQTGGIRYRYDSELLEDVFTMNDFRIPLRPPNHPLYFNTEFIGHMYPTKRNDNIERITEHTMRHARVHNQLASDKAVCRRHRLVCFRLQHPFELLLQRSHLLSRRCRYLSHSETSRRLLQIAVRPEGGDRSGARLRLVARRPRREFQRRDGLLKL